MISAEQKKRIRDSFAALGNNAAQFVPQFYDHLFRLDPELRPLFSTELSMQSQKLFQTIAFAIESLDNLDRLIPYLHELGADHARLGVTEQHYALVVQSLLETLAIYVPDWSTEDIAAWNGMFILAANEMVKGGASARKPHERSVSHPSQGRADGP